MMAHTMSKSRRRGTGLTIIATSLPLLSLQPHALIPNAKHAADVGTVILQKPCFVYALGQQLGVHNGAESCICIQGMES